jgi:hypothetical protein
MKVSEAKGPGGGAQLAQLPAHRVHRLGMNRQHLGT